MRPTITPHALADAMAEYAGWLKAVDEELVRRQQGAWKEGNPVKCEGPGCNACCKIPVTITCMEGLIVARYLMDSGRDTPEMRTLLYESADEMNRYAPKGAEGQAGFYALGRQCVFIGEDGGCSIYPARPAICRLCTSLRGPADCHERFLGNRKGKDTVLQVGDMRAKLEELAKHHAQVIGCGDAWALPEMVLWGLHEWDAMRRTHGLRGSGGRGAGAGAVGVGDVAEPAPGGPGAGTAVGAEHRGVGVGEGDAGSGEAQRRGPAASDGGGGAAAGSGTGCG